MGLFDLIAAMNEQPSADSFDHNTYVHIYRYIIHRQTDRETTYTRVGRLYLDFLPPTSQRMRHLVYLSIY